MTRYGSEVSVPNGEEIGSYTACDSGEAVTGGGYEITTSPAKVFVGADRPSVVAQLGIIRFYPAPSNGAKATGWYSSLKNESGSEIKFFNYVLCASP